MINETTTFLGGILGGTIKYLEALLGGIFGLYLILVLLRWYESRRLVNILKNIDKDVRKIGSRMGVKLPERESMFQKLKQKRSNSKKVSASKK